ncbi:MAG: glycine rich domain-containing protein [Bacilli bacterium]|nr:glycine rich domain-containing protein [Bacilli bacterium]
MNKKGFVLGGFIYLLMALFLLLLLTILSVLAANKVSLDKIKDDVLYEVGEESGASMHSFSYNESYYAFIVPTTGLYKIELWGASGGDFLQILGGKGSYTSGTIQLEKGTKLYIYVGGNPGTGETGGYNGGQSIYEGQGLYGRAGGGATDIRLISGSWDDETSLKSRIMVAAGGGGANYRNYADQLCGYGQGNGGAGGGLIGYDGISEEHTYSDCTYGWALGTGGMQTSGGQLVNYSISGTETDRITTGGFGMSLDILNPQSGGGAGYYTGGIGGHGGAGGGSSFISGHNGCDAINASGTHTGQADHYSGKVFSDTIMIDGNGYFWTNVKESQSQMPNPAGGYYDLGVGNSGNGYARITKLI